MKIGRNVYQVSWYKRKGSLHYIIIEQWSLINSNVGLVDDGDMKYVSKLDGRRCLDKARLPFVACIVK